jgi:two-component system response regulator
VNSGTILLVEDNPDDVMFTRRAFEKNKIFNELVVATDGEQALDYLLPADDSKALHPALVLLDVNLPKVDGLEVLRRIRSHSRTASNEERDIVDSYRLGANSFVRKPVMFSDFVDATKVLGVYWLLVNQPVPTWRGEG